MPRHSKLDRSVHVHLYIPSSIWSKVQLELYSDIEGRVPYGETTTVVTELLKDWLKTRGIEA